MTENRPDDLRRLLQRILNASMKWSARTVIPATALVSIIHAGMTGTPISATFQLIGAGVGASALANILAKFDHDEPVSDDEIRHTVENALKASDIEELLTKDEFQEEIANLFKRFNILGTALQIHENSIVERILQGVSYYHKLSSEVILQLQNLRETTAQLHPEVRYLSRLIYGLKWRQGSLQYVDLSVQVSNDNLFSGYETDELCHPAYAVFITSKPQVRRLEPPIPLDSLWVAVDSYPLFALVGEPGAGKSTALRRIALEAAWKRIRDSNEPMPIYRELPKWGLDQTLEEFLNQDWFLDMDLMIALVRGDAALYLDGLNEMGAKGVDRFETLRKWLHGLNRPARAIITCRTADYFREFDLDITTVIAQQLDENRIQQFAQNYLDTRSPSFLAHVIPPDEMARGDARHLFRLATNPFTLGALITIYKTSPDGDLPTNIGLLFRQLAFMHWNREQPTDSTGSIPFEQAERAFGQLAFEMIDQDKPIDVPISYATAKTGNPDLLNLGVKANYLIINNDHVRFYHQLMQEYFAAVAFNLTWRNRISGIKPGFYVTDDGVYYRKSSKWDNTIIALTGIYDSDEFLFELIEIDPFLVAMCVRTGIEVANVTYNKLIKEIINKLRHEFGDLGGELYEATEILKSLDHNLVVSLLINTLNHKDAKVRQGVVYALGELGDSSALAPLIRALYERNHHVCIRAAQALGKIKNTTAIPALLETLWNRTPDIQKAVASALGELRDPVAVSALIKLLNKRAKSLVGARSEAAVALGKIGDEIAVPALLEALHDQSDYLRRRITEALGAIGDPTAVPGLLNSLQDNEPFVRQHAAEALGKIGDASAVPRLVNSLKDSDDLVHWKAAEALGAIGDPTAVPGLLNSLQHKDTDRRLHAVEALGKIANPEAVLGLISQLSDTTKREIGAENRVCDHAAEALERIATPMALTAVVAWRIKELSNFEKVVRWREELYCDHAAEALERIGTPEALHALERWRRQTYPGKYIQT